MGRWRRPEFYTRDLIPYLRRREYLARLYAGMLLLVSPVVVPALVLWEERVTITKSIRGLFDIAFGVWK